MKFIFIALMALILGALIFGVNIILYVLRWILGLPTGSNKVSRTQQQMRQQTRRTSQTQASKKRDKVFKDEDGEYVDYEEVE